ILEEERESRGDRLTFASGIVRDVLYAALSRRKRRSLHRKYADLLEQRYAGRLERVYPELVHHFSQADVPEKTVEYGLKLSQKSLENFSPEDAIRVAKVTLEYLEDEEWAGERALEGDARMLLSQGYRMSGNVDGALREAEAAVRIHEAAAQPGKAIGAMHAAAETAWQARRTDDARRWVERGIEAAQAGGASDHLMKLLALGATVANLRGEYAKVSAYQAEIERLAPKEKPVEEEIPRGGTLVVAMSNPIAATEPAVYETTEEHEVLANVFETIVTTDAQGNLTPNLCERWSLEDDSRTIRLHLRQGVVFSDGAPLTAAAVKASLERSIRLSQGAMPAAFVSILGVAEYLKEEGDGVTGITAPSEREIEIRLRDPLPIFPSLLTDGRTAIAIAPPDGRDPKAAIGTGPFRSVEHAPSRAVLERNPRYWKEPSARLDRIEFQASLQASEIADGLRSGRLDLARDLLPQDLDGILREPRFRTGLVETPKKNTYFAVFHTGSPAGSNPAFRRALAGAVHSQEFVWGALGRFAMPATGLIPPGILGHDPGRRRAQLPREKAIELLRTAGLPSPVRLKAAVHPILQDQYAALTQELFRIWGELGVEVEVATRTMREYLECWHAQEGIDLLIGRWIADYDDPDNFTFGFFHSGGGRLRAFYSSPESDRILEEARSEARPAVREGLYRKFEHDLLEAAILAPLFHDVDYRVGGPGLRGVQLRSTAPYVNYSEIGKATASSRIVPERAAAGGTLNIPIAGVLRSIDPGLAETVEQGEVLPNVFEPLTWPLEGSRIVPWLAAETMMEDGGRRIRVRLRPGVRFHDGRRLTARDVRYSFERLLLNTQSGSRYLLSPIRGARLLIEGAATDLEGFHIVSPTEFYADLEKPVSFFPAVVSFAATAIVPEGTGAIGSSWKNGAVGTGPFRVVAFEPGRRLELERNPYYWREGHPRSEGVVFRFGVSPEETRDEFLAGRLSLAWDLLPADAEAFRHDPRFAGGYRESPRLTTYFVVFNCHRGVLRDVERRRSLVKAVDVPGLVLRTLGRLAIPAQGLIPPGLLGHSTAGPRPEPGSASAAPSDSSAEETLSHERVELSAAIHPIFFGEFSAFLRQLTEAFRQIGFLVRPANRTMAEYLEFEKKPDVDLYVGRWNADYPDADTFVHGVLHSESGFLGRYAGRPDLDQLAEQGRAELDPRMRHSVYRRVEDLIAREALLLPLFHDQVYCFVRPDVEGLDSLGANPVVRYDTLWIRR
ncbi:MAG: ABC transporter substrate-binding protein, partial [Thermoanaerobaculia bacterium]